MVKAVDKAMVIGDICLVEKTGGRSGTTGASDRPVSRDAGDEPPRRTA